MTTKLEQLKKILAEGTDKNGYQFILEDADIYMGNESKTIRIGGYGSKFFKRLWRHIISKYKK